MRRLRRIPPILRQAMAPDETVIRAAYTASGHVLAVSRFGLWQVCDQETMRIDWPLVSHARLRENTLHMTLLEPVEKWDDDTAVLRAGAELEWKLPRSTRLTDEVHDRVRRSVAASAYVAGDPGGAWIVLRRVPGHDGLAAQICLVEECDHQDPMFMQAAAAQLQKLRHSLVPD